MDFVSGILGGESKRKYKKYFYRYKDFLWSFFCKVVYECSDMEFEEVYFF